MEDQNKDITLFNQLNSIVNIEQYKRIDSYVKEFIKNIPLHINDELEEQNDKNTSWGWEVNFTIKPGGSILFKTDARKERFCFELISPKGHILTLSNIQLKNNLHMKFFYNFLYIILIIIQKKMYFMVFDLRIFKIEQDFFLYISEQDFKSYINKKFSPEKTKDRNYGEKIGYIRIRTNVSVEEARKSLIENNNDEIEAIMSIKKERRRKKEVLENQTKENNPFEDIHLMSLEVGAGLLTLIDPQNPKLINHFNPIRKKLEEEIGIYLPFLLFKDNLMLKPNEYIIRIKGSEISRGEVIINRFLIIGNRYYLNYLNGIKCIDPISGLPALWIEEAHIGKAQKLGFMIFNHMDIIITHIIQIMESYTYEFINLQAVLFLLDKFKQNHPELTGEINYKNLSTGEIKTIIQNLLKEGIHIKDFVSIMETLCKYSKRTKNTDLLTEYVREALSYIICSKYQDTTGIINIIILDPAIENLLIKSSKKNEHNLLLNLDVNIKKYILNAIGKETNRVKLQGYIPVIICPPEIRLPFRRLVEKFFPDVVFLSYNEIAPRFKIKVIGYVSLSYISFNWFSVRLKNLLNSIKKDISIILKAFKKTKKNIKSLLIGDKKNYTCITCGWENSSSNIFCLSCGEDLPDYIIKGKPGDNIFPLDEKQIKTSKLENLIDWVEKDVGPKVNKISHETGATSHEAFLALYDTNGDPDLAIKFINSGEVEKEDYGQLLFESLTWQKMEYIISSTSCSLGEAFRALVEFNEDEVAAAQAVKDRKKGNN